MVGEEIPQIWRKPELTGFTKKKQPDLRLARAKIWYIHIS